MGAYGSEPRVRREVNELSLLFDISRILESSMDLRDVFGPVLSTISKGTGIVRGVITLLNRKTSDISIESAIGLSPDQKKRARTNTDWEDVSFLCVPIKLGNEVIGTLSVDRLFSEGASLDENLRLFSKKLSVQ
jgi:Nif-specific regulatory protein